MSVTFSLPAHARATDAGSPKFFAPDAPDMPAYMLPNVLTAADGRKITTADEWRKIRRPEILELFRKHVYGRVPSTRYEKRFKVVKEDPRAMDGAATLKQVEITISAAGKSLTIPLTLFVPNKAAKPVPAFLLICNRSRDDIDPTREKKSDFWPAEAVIARGYAVAAFFNGDVAPDRKDSFKEGIHGLLDRARPADAWGTLAAWAWGASRCLDYLETDKDIAHDKVAMIGHSRGGKTAPLWAGAEDERFAMVCSNDSGCGGAALSRRRNPQKETVAKINHAFPHWFDDNFKLYNDREDKLPVDQHMLIALIALVPYALPARRRPLGRSSRRVFKRGPRRTGLPALRQAGPRRAARHARHRRPASRRRRPLPHPRRQARPDALRLDILHGFCGSSVRTKEMN